MIRIAGPVAGVAALLLATACGGDDSNVTQPDVGRDVDLASAPTALAVNLPAGEVQQGWPNTIASGDFNGDGATDIVIGAPFADGPDGARQDAGAAYILLGPLSGAIDLSSPDASKVVVLGAEAGDNLGGGVAAGDLNGDSIDDLIIGAPASNGLVDIRTDMGEAYVIFGGPDLAGTFDIFEQVQDFTLQPAEGYSTLGKVFAVGDLNGDDINDLVAGAPYAGREPNTPPGGPRTTVGEVYVVYGGPNLGGTVSVARDEDDLRLVGGHQYDQFGGSVALADIDGDGSLDIIVGASGYDGASGSNAESGAVFVFSGGSAASNRLTESGANLTIVGPAGFTLGTIVATFDLDTDGKLETGASAPSAPNASGPEPGAGRFYSVPDPSSTAATIDVSDCNCADVLFGTTPGEFFPAAVSSSLDGHFLALGSPSVAARGRANSGIVYLERAAPRSTATSTGTASASGDADIRVFGAAAGDGLGSAVAFADIDGDGTTELLAFAAPAGDTASATLYAVSLNP